MIRNPDPRLAEQIRNSRAQQPSPITLDIVRMSKIATRVLPKNARSKFNENYLDGKEPWLAVCPNPDSWLGQAERRSYGVSPPWYYTPYQAVEECNRIAVRNQKQSLKTKEKYETVSTDHPHRNGGVISGLPGYGQGRQHSKNQPKLLHPGTGTLYGQRPHPKRTSSQASGRTSTNPHSITVSTTPTRLSPISKPTQPRPPITLQSTFANATIATSPRSTKATAKPIRISPHKSGRVFSSPRECQ